MAGAEGVLRGTTPPYITVLVALGVVGIFWILLQIIAAGG